MAAKRDEREAWARYLIGLLLSDNCSYERAAELLRDAIEYMPELVAAHVELGVVYSGLGRYEEMLEEFREAIRLDVRAVREAVREEPKELEDLWRILYPSPEAGTTGEQRREPILPAEVREAAALVEVGREEIAAVRCGHAVELIERALRLDHAGNTAYALLALAYLLSWEGGGEPTTANEGSVLWEAAPELAGVLFKKVEAGSRCHNNGQG
jgi:tetratricopeptide (TPR) repeat protein